MTNLIQADFNGTLVSFQGNGYLNATTIAKQFGKQPKDYLRNERTKDYINALILNLNSKRQNRLLKESDMILKQHGGSPSTKGTWLHPKLAIDFARWLSAEFAVWCDEQIEKILHGNQIEQQKLDDLSTSDDRVPLRQAISKLVTKRGLSYSDAYIMVNQRFNHEHLEEYTLSEVPQAIQYVHELTLSNALEGELMPRTELPRKDQSNGLALMMHGTKVKNVQDEKISKARHLINEASLLIDQAEKCSGAIWDGLYESRMYMNFSKDERQLAHQKSDDIFESWKARRKF